MQPARPTTSAAISATARRRGVILARSRRDPAVAGGAYDLADFEVLAQVIGQRGSQCLRAGVIRLTHPYATRGEVSGLASGAHDSDNVGRRHAAGQKLLNRETPKVS